MREKLKAQWNETQNWGKDFSQTTEKPFEHTQFSYQHEGKQAQLNAESAFKDAPDMVPFVLSINSNVESICFDDKLTGEKVTYVRERKEMDFVENLTDGKICKTKVHRTKNTNAGENDKDYYIS